MTIILDMGGVLMQHNMQGCIERFKELIGEDKMQNILGLAPNAEGIDNSLMEHFERGEVSADVFVSTLLRCAVSGTTKEDIVLAWNTMHGGIPEHRMEKVKEWKQQGHRIFLLSNNNELHWQDVFSHYDMSVFEHCFASHIMHAIKPEKAIFQKVDTFLNERQLPKPYYFVDDLEANRKAAERFGWKTYEDLDSLDKALRI